jgi:hypothetical protein
MALALSDPTHQMSAPSRAPVSSNRVVIPQHVVFRSFVEETVVLNLESGRYHGLNRTAGRMLELLGELGEMDAVADAVVEETGAPGERVREDLQALCDSLAERGLIQLTPAPSA